MDTKRSSEPATRNSTVAQKGRGSSAMKNSKQEEVKTKEHFRRSTGSISSLSNVGETVIGSLRTSTVGPKRDRKDATKERSASKIEVIRTTMKQVGPVVAADVYEKLNLYVLADKFYLEPRDRNGELRSESYLEIDRVSDELHVRNASESPIPIVHAEISSIFGIVGVVKLISGNGLIIIKRAELVGEINGHDIWTILETEVIPYKKGTMHLTEKQRRFNKHFIDMIQLVLSTGGFYYSTTFDITRTFQWLSENATPGFRDLSLMERADDRFVWNRYLSAQFIADGRLGKYTLPIMHGFVGIRRAAVNGNTFQLAIISRRSVYRAGVRFFMRGVNSDGHSANYVETEQIIQHDRGSPDNRVLSSFVQVRGSIPLYWSQHPNLRWQPVPTMKPNDHQLEAYVKHMKMQREIYGGKHVIVNLINQKGREKRIGGELERTVVQGNLDFVRYNAFDFHKECHAMNWDRLSILQDQLTHEINSFGFFLSSLANPDKVRTQAGYFRTNCMDCLDRTNVVQAMIAKESLLQQLIFMDIAPIGSSIDQFAEFNSLFKNLWADNGDECSKQYAGTGALKADFTRIGKRTYGGAINDGINALTRYFKNNFYDGYRQDAIDLFLGNFRIDPNNLPDSLEQSVINFDFHGVAILFAIFAATMVILCLIVSESYTVSVFWLIVLALLLTFIVLNGEEFVNSPKLKVD
ncbi:hypothetical protein QR680_009396 [Steinernema hermaphroditum]|uniref:Phosphatidylinositol-3-phosphatase SAC1 n=1 Tax=Steinernema hermaphroditum TaxID=289476 RepID=A0AA39ILD4_9BILA|nr:hypothetical protein QR680_009396 [Steinernema hermaphroditum]